jgi:iron-sulfur cluster assembly protein
MVEVTPQASEAIKAIMAEKNMEGTLRIFMQQGCGGAQLALGIDEVRPSDDSYEADGLTYVVDKELGNITGKLTLDYVNEAAQAGFTISSEKPLPAPQGGCDCGSGCSC